MHCRNGLAGAEYAAEAVTPLDRHVRSAREPWDAPERFQKMYRDDYGFERYLFGYGVRKDDVRDTDYPILGDLYAAEVTFSDHWIGRLLDTIERLGMRDDTIVVFASDHGTHLGEFGCVQKTPGLLNSAVAHIPLIIQHPDRKFAGKRVSGFVSAADYMPAFLALVGIREFPGLAGKNFWPLVENRVASNYDRLFMGFGNFAAVRDRKWHYFQNFRGSEIKPGLFGPGGDSRQTNVVSRYPGVAAEHRGVDCPTIRRDAAARGAREPVVSTSFDRNGTRRVRSSWPAHHGTWFAGPLVQAQRAVDNLLNFVAYRGSDGGDLENLALKTRIIMWKKTKETGMETATNPPISRPVESGSMVSSSPRFAPADSRLEARIGKSVSIKGQLTGQEDIYLDGDIEGVVELPENRFTVGRNGKVQANIKAKEVDVMGTVHGDIIAGERITIRKDATLVGNLKSATISIEDGAFFKGSIDIVRQVPVKVAPPPPPAPPAPTAPTPAVRAATNAPAAAATSGPPVRPR